MTSGAPGTVWGGVGRVGSGDLGSNLSSGSLSFPLGRAHTKAQPATAALLVPPSASWWQCLLLVVTYGILVLSGD